MAPRGGVHSRLTPCKVEGVTEQVLCGSYSVWENRATRTGRKIDLAIVVLPALGPAVAPDPFVELAGGPGGSVTDGASDWAEWRELRAHRDIVLIDQRGTGRSHRLDCMHPKDPKDIQGYFDPPLPLADVKRCRAELDPVADLSQYASSVAADDLDEVRAWLGYDKIDLDGGSYGTRAAQVYTRQHGDHVRTATLIGLVGMDQHTPLYHARDGKRALDMVVAACAKDSECARQYPELASEHEAVLAALDRAPAHAIIEGTPVTISRGAFAEDMRFALYGAGVASMVPYVIDRAARGDFDPFARMALLFETHLRSGLAYGMFLSVTCTEDVPFITPAEIGPAIAGTYLGDYRLAMQLAACKEWPRGRIAANFSDHLRSTVPMLIVSGAYDPVTPPSWAEAALPSLPRARHLLIPTAHHGDEGLSHRECLRGIIAAFIDRGTADGLDTSCIETMQPPPFVTNAAGFDAVLRG
jgi:pimeloyl-ACP methyl ester carboxylesterase